MPNPVELCSTAMVDAQYAKPGNNYERQEQQLNREIGQKLENENLQSFVAK